MPSERAANWFGDIVRACEQIEQWVLEVAGIDRIMANEMARSAVERQLLIISEAAIRLRNVDDDIAERLAPEIDWAGVRGMGNIIRHRYDDMDFEIVADVLERRLTPLRAACGRALGELK